MDWVDRVGSRIKLRDLHILLAVVEWKSMAEAARRLAVSQPVVSRAIADLEHAAVPLCLRDWERLVNVRPNHQPPSPRVRRSAACGR